MIHLSWFTLSLIFLAPASLIVVGTIGLSLLNRLTKLKNKR